MQTLGRYDRVDLPELGLKNIHAKVDTGAYRCSLHCQHVQEANGQLEFTLLDTEHPSFTGIKFTTPNYCQRDIKNSFGEIERRYIITTTIKIFDETIPAEFSLSNRGTLKFPILIGRKILRGRYLINVTTKNLSYKAKRAKKRIQKNKK